MNYITFTKELEKNIKKKLGKQYQVSIEHVLKNNGLTKDAILIRENNSNISPNIYLEHFYDRYCECESLDEISEEIMVSYQEALIQKPTDIEDCFHFQKYKEKIFFRIVHLESNKTLLENIPHIPYLDLAITFHCMVSDESMQMKFFTISNLLLKEWELSIDALYQIALENTQKLFPAHMDTLEHIMEALLRNTHSYQSLFPVTDFESELSNIPDDPNLQIFVITNQYGVNGASVILYPDLLDCIAQKLQSDLYLLPSSIHEFLVLPADSTIYSTLVNMVSEVNTHEVADDDILSNQVYFYNWKEHTLTEKANSNN